MSGPLVQFVESAYSSNPIINSSVYVPVLNDLYQGTYRAYQLYIRPDLNEIISRMFFFLAAGYVAYLLHRLHD